MSDRVELAKQIASFEDGITVEDAKRLLRRLDSLGYAVVRKEPTEKMIDVGYQVTCEHDYGDTVPSTESPRAVYRAMIAASPSQ